VGKIFISYRRADSKVYAGRIHEHLKHSRCLRDIFFDVCGSIPPGADFRREIRKAVDNSDVVLVVIGKQWENIVNPTTGIRRLDEPDDFVKLEINFALQNPKCRVIPVLVDNASMPSASSLPDEIRNLAPKQAVIIRDDPNFQHDMKRLIRNIGGYRCYVFIGLFILIMAIIIGLFSIAFLCEGCYLPEVTPTSSPSLPATHISIDENSIIANPNSTETQTPTTDITISTPTPMPSHTPNPTETPTATNTLTQTASPTQTILSTQPSVTNAMIEIRFTENWFRIRLVSDSHVSLDGLSLRNIETNDTKTPSDDFSLLKDSRLANPDQCYFYTPDGENPTQSSATNGCKRRESFMSDFWIPDSIAIYWQNQEVGICTPDEGDNGCRISLPITPTPTPTQTPPPVPTETPTETITPSPTFTPTASHTPTATATNIMTCPADQKEGSICIPAGTYSMPTDGIRVEINGQIVTEITIPEPFWIYNNLINHVEFNQFLVDIANDEPIPDNNPLGEARIYAEPRTYRRAEEYCKKDKIRPSLPSPEQLIVAGIQFGLFDEFWIQETVHREWTNESDGDSAIVVILDPANALITTQAFSRSNRSGEPVYFRCIEPL